MKRILLSLIALYSVVCFGQSIITDINLTSPEDQAILKTSNPTFGWKLIGASTPGSKTAYHFMLYQIDQNDRSGADPFKKPFYEKQNISETSFRYDGPTLDSTKGYLWKVESSSGGSSNIGSFSFWTWNWCFLFMPNSTFRVCAGQPVSFTAWALMTGSGAQVYTWTGPGGSPVSGTWSSGAISITIPASHIPTTAGIYTYSLTVSLGTSCSRTVTFQIQVFDPVSAGGPTTIVPSNICDGETAVISSPGATGGANIQWSFRDNCHPSWTPTTMLPSTPYGIQGNPAGTNQQFPCSCTSASFFTTREFQAHVGSDDPNAPLCASTYTSIGILKIYCKPSLTISVSPPGPICNNNTPVTFTLTATAVGNVTWTSSSSGFSITGSYPTWTATGTPPTSGNIVFTATATTGGPCPSVSQSVTILVDQPVICSSITTTRDPSRIVCPPWDAELHVNCQNVGSVEWAYCKIPPGTAPWTPFGGNGTTQNTNNATLGIYVHTWYRAIVHSVLNVCTPETLYVDIDIFPPLIIPVVSPAGPLTVCEGYATPVLTVGVPPIGTTYTWMHNGNAVTGGPPNNDGPPVTWTATDAGYWWVEAQNQCNTAISNIVKVNVEVITVEVGPCCGTIPTTLFVTSANSSIWGNFIPGVTPGSSIEWHQGSCTGPVVSTNLNVPNPIAGNTYCVRVKRNLTSCWSVCKCFVAPKKCL